MNARARGCCLALAVLVRLGDASAAGQEPPNILVVLADDMGWSDAGCYGGEIDTPHLDDLAAGGIRFTDFYNTGRCWPTRTALVTGYYPQQVNMDPRAGPRPPWCSTIPMY
ncbi:MAG: sulfatase-like hydrolase/transferase [Bdellovibrionaceae bacterium]|nr:sulfatase-like hydrolase/transferase [Pseudobdellovibrionaceae bacterium]